MAATILDHCTWTMDTLSGKRTYRHECRVPGCTAKGLDTTRFTKHVERNHPELAHLSQAWRACGKAARLTARLNAHGVAVSAQFSHPTGVPLADMRELRSICAATDALVARMANCTATNADLRQVTRTKRAFDRWVRGVVAAQSARVLEQLLGEEEE
jgi:hypothetical protein